MTTQRFGLLAHQNSIFLYSIFTGFFNKDPFLHLHSIPKTTQSTRFFSRWHVFPLHLRGSIFLALNSEYHRIVSSSTSSLRSTSSSLFVRSLSLHRKILMEMLSSPLNRIVSLFVVMSSQFLLASVQKCFIALLIPSVPAFVPLSLSCTPPPHCYRYPWTGNKSREALHDLIYLSSTHCCSVIAADSISSSLLFIKYDTIRYFISHLFCGSDLSLFLSSFNIGLPSHICSNVEYPYQKSLPPLTTFPYPHPLPHTQKNVPHIASYLYYHHFSTRNTRTHNRHTFYIFIIFGHHDSFLQFIHNTTSHHFSPHHTTSHLFLPSPWFVATSAYGYGHTSMDK